MFRSLLIWSLCGALALTGCPSKSSVSGPATATENLEAPSSNVQPSNDESPNDVPHPTASSPTANPAAPPEASSPEPPVNAAANPPPPQPPSGACDPQQDCCRKDADCVTLDVPQPCACPPCGRVWRWTLNQRGYQDYEDRWSRRRCRMPECESCSGEYVGQAACVEGRCVVR
jgi:hypothetical protein